MKKQHLLSICITGALLTACGSGGSAGIKNNNTNITPNNGSTNNNSSTDNGKNNNGSANNGSTTDNATNNNNPNTNPTNGKLPYPHKVPTELQSAVENALKIPVRWNSESNHKSSITMGDKSYNKGDSVNLADFDLGLTKTTYSASEDGEYSDKGNVKVYRQHYSAIMTFFPTEGKLASNNDSEKQTEETITFSIPIGYHTKTMPETGKATYKGKSFYQTEEGNLNLAVDFGNNTVNGDITGLSAGKVTLEKGIITQIDSETIQREEKKLWGYKGNATLSDNGKFSVKIATTTKKGIESVANKDFTADKYDFKYDGLFFGKKAEETAGSVWVKSKTNQQDNYNFTDIIGFAGQRGKIKK